MLFGSYLQDYPRINLRNSQRLVPTSSAPKAIEHFREVRIFSKIGIQKENHRCGASKRKAPSTTPRKHNIFAMRLIGILLYSIMPIFQGALLQEPANS